MHNWQNGTRCRDGVNMLWCRSHLVWLVFEDTCTCFVTCRILSTRVPNEVGVTEMGCVLKRQGFIKMPHSPSNVPKKATARWEGRSEGNEGSEGSYVRW